MRYLSLLLVMLGFVFPAAAQDSNEDGKSYLESLLQDTLSDIGRKVTVTGFAGALSSNATLDEMTIADGEGVWLTMRNASLIWSRSALLRGRLEITELTAKEIALTRLPAKRNDLSPKDAEATDFSLPVLPVSVDIDTIRTEHITLAAEVLGEPATLTLFGSIELDAGDGAALLNLRRTDREDRLTLKGAFSNQNRVLSLNVDFDEADDGLASRLLRIPDSPALRLQIEGEAPISDYEARIALSSDGEPRFGGTARVASNTQDEAGGYKFSADLDGDVRPLFTADLHPFFGDRSSLDLAGLTHPDGRVTLERLAIGSGAMTVAGSLALDPKGWPEKFKLDGQIGSGERIHVPVTGPETTVESLTFSAGFDAQAGQAWGISAALSGFERNGFRIGRAQLTGLGQIERGADPQVSGRLGFETDSLKHKDTNLARAIGTAPSGTLTFQWKPDAPLMIEDMNLQSGDLLLTGGGQVDQLADGLPVTGRVVLRSSDISRFAGLAGREIAGGLIAAIDGTGTVLGGAFDLSLEADTTALSIDEPRLDPLLAAPTALKMHAIRSTGGTELKRLSLQSEEMQADVSGRLNSASGQLSLTARITEIARVEPQLSGPTTLTTLLSWQADGALTLHQLEADLAGATLSATGKVIPSDPTLPAEGQLSLSASDLTKFARIAKHPLAGSVELDLEGSGTLQGDNLDTSFNLTGSAFRTGIAELDRLIAGRIEAAGSLAIGGDVADLRYLKLNSPRLKLNASGSSPGAPVAISLRLPDMAVLTPSFSGPATARGTVTIRDSLAHRLGVALNATGPGGIATTIKGEVNDYGQSLALDLTGSAPLGLANRFIKPHAVQGQAAYTLALNGPPRLSSLSGRVEVAGARVAMPTLEFAANNLSATLILSAGSADIVATGSAGTGGQFRVAGPLDLSPPYPASLTVGIEQLGLFDPTLYQTTVDGDLTVTGDLQGGARIGGSVALGRTELRVPSGSGSIIGTLPDIQHLYEPPKVAQTRKRAGLVGQTSKGPSRPYPLDVTVSAPNRIFVRGRGLDAELGGQVRLTGTTADVNASGVFELIRGRLDILGKRLVLSEGLIDLRGALDPYLYFVGESTSDDFLVKVILSGSLSAPEVTFTSEPELPQEEVAARLLFGRGLQAISPFQAAQLVSAVATLSGHFSGGVTGQLRNALGLSDLDIATTNDGATQFRVGAYLSDNIYSEFSVDTDGNEEINLNLDVSRHVTIKGRASDDGNTGIGIYFEKDY